MKTRIGLLIIALLLLTGPFARGQAAKSDVLATLRPAHPRLLVRDSDLAAVKDAIAKDPLAKRWHEQLKADAEKMLTAKPIEHVLIGPRLLDKSRTCLTR